MPNCAVAKCGNYNRITIGTGIRYFRFPKSKELSKQWIKACCRKDKINLKNATVCSSHFEPDCFQYSLKQQLLNYTAKNERNLKAEAVPTLSLPKKRLISDKNSERSVTLVKKRQFMNSGEAFPTPETTLNLSLVDIKNEPLDIQEEELVEEKVNICCMDKESQIKELQTKLLTMEAENLQLKNNLKLAENEVLSIKTSLNKLLTPGLVIITHK